MPYSVGLSIRRGVREVSRTIIQIEAENRNKAILKAEDKVDRECGPDYWSKALAVTEAFPSETLLAV